MVWTLIEPGVAIIASSLATIRPLLRRMRVRGFESTDRTPSNGAASSHTHTKRTVSFMPGHGPNDVSLDDVANDTSDLPKKTTAISTRQVGFDAYHQARQIPRKEATKTWINAPEANQVRRPSDAPSEIYVIEGVKHSPNWSEQDGDRSVDEMHDLEEQSQEYRHGISSRRS